MPGQFQAQDSFSNAYSVAFDGADDYAATSADATLADKTYSWWAKSLNSGTNGVFCHGSPYKGAFYTNYSAGRPTLHATSVFRYWNDTAAQDDGSWHHWALFIDASDISGCKLYCDASELGVAYTHSGGSQAAYSSIELGTAQSALFEGSLDEFAIFDGDKTGIISTLYNSGIPADLAGLSGLEHWWRMGDNNAGTGITVTDEGSGGNDATLTNGPTFSSSVPS